MTVGMIFPDKTVLYRPADGIAQNALLPIIQKDPAPILLLQLNRRQQYAVIIRRLRPDIADGIHPGVVADNLCLQGEFQGMVPDVVDKEDGMSHIAFHTGTLIYKHAKPAPEKRPRLIF